MVEIDDEIILREEDVFLMLDGLLEKRELEWWSKFYSNKDKPVPFFTDAPDENLVSYLERNIFEPGRVLDVGCGNGRNSLYLAKQGFQVDGIDFSKTSIEWASKNAKDRSLDVKFINKSIFDFEAQDSVYDYIYDAGCLHHIKPHRRNQYLHKLVNLLRDDGYFALTCFNLKGGANISDYDVYREFSMHGGLGFSELKLKKILEPYFSIIEFREMKECTSNSLFGKEFCWSVLAKKK
jgi:SAM-dependent methyltransferase